LTKALRPGIHSELPQVSKENDHDLQRTMGKKDEKAKLPANTMKLFNPSSSQGKNKLKAH
jgi:hypothetical protein